MMDLFSQEKNMLNLPQAKLVYVPEFYHNPEADSIFKVLLQHIPWQQDHISLFGKTYKQPRLTALYAENDKTYTYSGITMKPHPFNKLPWSNSSL